MKLTYHKNSLKSLVIDKKPLTTQMCLCGIFPTNKSAFVILLEKKKITRRKMTQIKKMLRAFYFHCFFFVRNWLTMKQLMIKCINNRIIPNDSSYFFLIFFIIKKYYHTKTSSQTQSRTEIKINYLHFFDN